MKIITLNLWGGRVAVPIETFLDKNSDIDAFLFQEIVESNGDKNRSEEKDRADVPKSLPNHQGYFRPALQNGWGLASFIKKGIVVEKEGDIFVHGEKNAEPVAEWWLVVGKNLQYVKVVSAENKKYTLFNLHGVWDPSGKGDTENRISQSKKLIEFIKTFEGEIVLCGDFNLRPDTESLRMIENELNLRNLVTEYGIKSTRTSLYTRSDEKFADYVLVSKGVKVNDFKVLPDEVSDHAALFVDFE